MKMAMKKYIYIIMCSLMALSMTSCNDYLEVYPENVEPTDKYWSTKEEVESTLFAAYYNLSCRLSYSLGRTQGRMHI